MGKSTLIKLLVQTWRSNGMRIIVTAASAKAARLIGGHTAHSVFWLGKEGRFAATNMGGKKNTEHFLWLVTADIIVVDEISMLTAHALAGINKALSYVISNSASDVPPSSIRYGAKSLIAFGDLYQLPAVERARHKEQVYES